MEIIANNKKAFHNFFISNCVEAGISLEGCEVKSVRLGGVSILDSYVTIKNGEMFLKNAYIKPYEKANVFKAKERRTRKLLLHRNEILKFEREVKEKGYTIVPTKLYINDDGLVKVEIGLAKGKKLYDKRQTLKDKQVKRDIEILSKRRFGCD